MLSIFFAAAQIVHHPVAPQAYITAMPFTEREFLDVFESYNTAVWPAQLFLYVLGLLAVALAVRSPKNSRYVAAIVAFFWVWSSLAYHAPFFRTINPAATIFTGTFLIEAGFIVWYGVVHARLAFDTGGPWFAPGAVLLAYALVVYPVLGLLLGQQYPHMPTFGLPCPTALFTFGMLMWTRPGAPRKLWAPPTLWSIMAVQAAFFFGIYEDFALIPAAGASIYYAFAQRRAASYSH